MAFALVYKLKYKFDESIVSMQFNDQGTRLAAITEGGFINIWNTVTGEKYFPILGPEAGLSACILWMKENAFLCGIQNGYLLSCFIDSGDEENMSLTVTKRKVLDTMSFSGHKTCIHTLAYERSLQCLAITAHDSVKLWKRNEREWEFYRSLTYPCMPSNPEQPVCITSIAWIPNESRILATYLNHDYIVIWDLVSLSVSRTIKSWGVDIHKSEILTNSGGTRLATVDFKNSFDVYDIYSGVVWSPSIAMQVFALKSIHRGTTCVLGSNGKAELFDIEAGLITQVLDQNDPATQVTAITGYQNDKETEFMIATASSKQCIVWKTETHEV